MGQKGQFGQDAVVESTLGEDYINQAMASQAIVPTWEADTIFAHYQAGDKNAWRLAEEGAGLPEELEGGLKQAFSVLTLDLGDIDGLIADAAHAFHDVDGDGYLEQTDWVAANQAMLVLDYNGDGQIGAGEFLTLDEDAAAGRAHNSVQWLDANGDNVLDSQDPAFAFLKLWIDINGDAITNDGELVTLAQVSIDAIDFSENPPVIRWSDGNYTGLTETHLSADIRGTIQENVDGGLLVQYEDGITELEAVRTHDYTGEAGHTHGGGDAESSDGHIYIDAGDPRLESLTNRSADQTQGTQALGAEAIVASETPAARVISRGEINIRAGDSRVRSTASVPVSAFRPLPFHQERWAVEISRT